MQLGVPVYPFCGWTQPVDQVSSASLEPKDVSTHETLLARYCRGKTRSERAREIEAENQVRGPDWQSSVFLDVLRAGFGAQRILRELCPQPGVLVKYGTWKPAPVRDSEISFWAFDPLMLWRSASAAYSRSVWHQEYSWCENSLCYQGRGYWATDSFRDPAIIKDDLFRVQLVVGQWRPGARNDIRSSAKLLAEGPPRVGFQPFWRALTLSFVQQHMWDEDGSPIIKGRWQLRFNVDLSEVWETVGHRGNEFARDDRRRERREKIRITRRREKIALSLARAAASRDDKVEGRDQSDDGDTVEDP